MRPLAAAALLLLAAPAVAAPRCAPVGDPAFGRPTDCRPAPPTPKPAREAESKGKWKTTPEGDHVFRFGDTTVKASGWMQFDFATGNSGSAR